MEPDGRTYLLPHPWLVRALLSVAGAFVLLITPYELWRGVWPLNVTTPFFGFMIAGGMSIGATAVWAGLWAPSAALTFSPGRIDIELRNPWGVHRRTVRSEEVLAFEVEEQENSEGPNSWYVVIRTRTGQPVRSRPLDSRAAADKQLAEFRHAFAGDEDQP